MKWIKIIVLFLCLTVIGIRIYLPTLIKSYVESQINKIPGYQLIIKDVNLHLLTGNYTLNHIELWKIPKTLPVPYIESSAINFSVEWSALLKGKFVAKVIANHPIINFVDDPHNKNQQLSIDANWVELVKSLFPLNINRFDAKEGEIYFRSYNGKPPFTNYIKNISFSITNMQNADHTKILLPSCFDFSGIPMGDGKIHIWGKFNPFTSQPTFSIYAKLTSLRIKTIANLIKHYSRIDVANGEFTLYGEAVAAKGVIKGYAKPFLKNLKIKNKKQSTVVDSIINGVSKVASKILQNPQNKTIATKINISGNIDDPDTSLLSIIGYLIRHAFIQSLLPQIDSSIKITDILYSQSKHTKDHFPLYRH